jgi:hypothetical protein
MLSVIFVFHRAISLLQADAETDEVYAQMTLQPLNPVIDYFFICVMCKLFRYLSSMVMILGVLFLCSKSSKIRICLPN